MAWLLKNSNGDVGDHVMPQFSDFWLTWWVLLGSWHAQHIQILQSLAPPRSPALYPISHHQIFHTIPSFSWRLKYYTDENAKLKINSWTLSELVTFVNQHDNHTCFSVMYSSRIRSPQMTCTVRCSGMPSFTLSSCSTCRMHVRTEHRTNLVLSAGSS